MSQKRQIVEGESTALDFEAEARKVERLAKYRALELNADYVPLSYFPLSLMPWTKLMFWIVKGMETGIPRIHVIDEYPDADATVHAGRMTFQVPSVVAHINFVPSQRSVPLTKENVLLRDDFTCQYTGQRYPASELNMDHVIPESRGGPKTWDNIVMAHYKVNEAKGNRTPKEAGLTLLKQPREPSVYELKEKGRRYPPPFIHPSWKDFLYYDKPEAA